MPKVRGWVVVRLLMSCGWVLCTIISVGRSMGGVLEALSCIQLVFEKCWDFDWVSGIHQENIENFDPQFFSLHPLCK